MYNLKHLKYAKYQAVAQDLNVHKASWLSEFKSASRSEVEFLGLCSGRCMNRLF